MNVNSNFTDGRLAHSGVPRVTDSNPLEPPRLAQIIEASIRTRLLDLKLLLAKCNEAYSFYPCVSNCL